MAGLLGAAAALTTVTGVHATSVQPTDPPVATSYSDLLQPIPNAMALLKADDARLAERAAAGETRVAQYFDHHHHHNNYDPGAAIIGGVIGGLIASQPHAYGPPPAYGPPLGACYWTQGRPVWNGYAWVRPRVQVCE